MRMVFPGCIRKFKTLIKRKLLKLIVLNSSTLKTIATVAAQSQ